MENYIKRKTKERIENYKEHLKIFSLIEIGLITFIYILIISLPVNGEDISVYGYVGLGIIFLLQVGIILKGFIRITRINNDIKNKRYKEIKCTDIEPVKVYFGKWRLEKNSRELFYYVKIYFPKLTLILPLENTIYIKRGLSQVFKDSPDYYKCEDKILQVKANLIYLEKSKVIISGASEYYKIIKEYITSKID